MHAQLQNRIAIYMTLYLVEDFLSIQWCDAVQEVARRKESTNHWWLTLSSQHLGLAGDEVPTDLLVGTCKRRLRFSR